MIIKKISLCAVLCSGACVVGALGGATQPAAAVGTAESQAAACYGIIGWTAEGAPLGGPVACVTTESGDLGEGFSFSPPVFIDYKPNPIDSDNDGLTDEEEVQLETSVNDADTDGDGLLDGEEFFMYGTLPALGDSDQDYLTDYEEIVFVHSNPNDSDSDGGGQLDGSEFRDGQSALDPQDDQADLDGDGLIDQTETEMGTSLFDPDSDEDGLLDYAELLCGSDPLKPDTDDGGEGDQSECDNHKNPRCSKDDDKAVGIGPVA